jgi:hypothetical protein
VHDIIYTAYSLAQRLVIKQITVCKLNLQFFQPPEIARSAHQTTDCVVLCKELLNKMAADETCRTRDERLHVG